MAGIENVDISKRYNVSYFHFEEDYDYGAFVSWMHRNWTLSFGFAFIYLVAIFTGRQLMHKRPAFDLKLPLTCWNFGLAIFSIVATWRKIPELIHVLKTFGFYSFTCHDFHSSGPIGVWTWLFAWSKVIELGDTAFIVLRKKPLLFLHWYHHVTVLVYSWLCCAEDTAPSHWFIVMNYSVHSLMYTYYALRAVGCRIPRMCSMFISTTQICQMFVGIIIVITASQYKANNIYCHHTDKNMVYGFIMYTTYFMLFVRFFYMAYMRPRSLTPGQQNGIHQKKLI